MNHIKIETAEYYLDAQNRYHGEYKTYHDNGQLRVHCFYVQGKYHGEYKTYHDNGQLHVHCFYADGVPRGEFKRYRDNGQLQLHCFFVDRVDLFDKVKPLVSDLSNITQEEKVILKLQLGLDL